MKIGIVSQARMTSTRLPGKVLLKAGDRSLLDWHIERLIQTELPVFLAVTTNPEDDILAEFARAHNLPPVWRGDEADVLSRYAGCAAHHNLDVIIRVTSDCPLIPPEIIRTGLTRYLLEADPLLYLSNTLHRTYPRGFDYEIFSRYLLNQAQASAVLASDREHVTPLMRDSRLPGIRQLSLTREAAGSDASGFRLTVDEPRDYVLVKRLIEECGAGLLDGEELLALLKSRPDLVALNADVEQKK